MISNKINVNGALHPYDTLTKKDKPSEWDKLDEALSDDQITNIVVSAPYDTGKSSFLSSYFLQHQIQQLKHPIKKFFNKKITKKDLKKDQEKARKIIRKGKADFRFISVPNFFEDITGKRNIEVELERDVIEQLLLSTSTYSLPDSSIPRLIRIKSVFIVLTYFLLMFLAFLITNVQIKLDRKFLIFIIIFILGAFPFYYFVHLLDKLTIDLSAKFDIGKAKIKANFTNKEVKNNIDNFVQYNDELNYFFDATKVRYVIFEDLDRYDTPLIFQRLRSLNKRLNSHRDKPIIFIYTTKDTVFDVTQDDISVADAVSKKDDNFAVKQKSKFFDYIISLVPFENIQNSVYFFRREIDKYNWLDADDKYLYELGLYITDYREIIAIVSDMAGYFINAKINSSNYSGNKLLGAMVYKNVYLSDFNNIYEHKSNLEYLLSNSYIIDRYMYLAMIGIVDDKGKEIFTGTTNDDSLLGRLKFWDENKNNLNKIGEYDEKLSKTIEYCKNKPILKCLLDNGLIDYDFRNYVFPIKYENINIEDIDSIKKIVLKTAKYDIHFNDPEAALRYLDKINFDFRYVYSSDILQLLLEKASKLHYHSFEENYILYPKTYNVREKQAYKILEEVERNIDYSFMSAIMQKLLKNADTKPMDIFIHLAFEDSKASSNPLIHSGAWPDYFQFVFSDNSEDKIDKEIAANFIINYWNEFEEYDKHYIDINTSIDSQFFQYFKSGIKNTKDNRINKSKVWMIGTFKDLNPVFHKYENQQ